MRLACDADDSIERCHCLYKVDIWNLTRKCSWFRPHKEMTSRLSWSDPKYNVCRKYFVKHFYNVPLHWPLGWYQGLQRSRSWPVTRFPNCNRFQNPDRGQDHGSIYRFLAFKMSQLKQNPSIFGWDMTQFGISAVGAHLNHKIICKECILGHISAKC